MVERPAAEQDIERTALEWTKARRFRDSAPQGFERLAGADGAPVGIAVGKCRGVHGAGRSAGNAVDPQPLFLEQPVEHTPGESAVRSPALQSQVDQDVIRYFLRRMCGGGRHRFLQMLVPHPAARVAFQSTTLYHMRMCFEGHRTATLV